MSQEIKAIFENGVFRPLDPVDLKEHQQVTLRFLANPSDRTEVSSETCFDLARRLGVLGVIDDAPEDLSTRLCASWNEEFDRSR